MRPAAAGLGVLDTVLETLAPWLDRVAPVRDKAVLRRSLRA